MNSDSGDVDDLGDPLLFSTISSLPDLPYVTGCARTFVSSEGCHIVAETTNGVGKQSLIADILCLSEAFEIGKFSANTLDKLPLFY